MKKFFVYCCIFLVLSGFVRAEIVDIKIDFARVQDVSGKLPSKTAACIIAWVGNDTKEKIFCRYQIDKTRDFFRDNNKVDHILDNSDNLLKANSQNFPIKIKDWLANIGKSLQGKKLPSIHQKLSKLFAEFVTKDFTEYTYPTTEEDMLFKFKNSKPHKVLLKNLDNSNVAFAILVHSEVHRAVSKSPSSSPNPKQFQEDMLEKYGSLIVNLLNNKEEVLRQIAETNLLENQKIVAFINEFQTTNYDVLTLVVEYADVLKKNDVKTQLDIIRNNRELGDESFIKSLKDNIQVWILSFVGVVLLILFSIILLKFRKLQKKVDETNNVISRKEMKLDKATRDKLATQISNVVHKKMLPVQFKISHSRYKSSLRPLFDTVFGHSARVFKQGHWQWQLTALLEETTINAITTQIADKLSQKESKLIENSNVNLSDNTNIASSTVQLEKPTIDTISTQIAKEVSNMISEIKSQFSEESKKDLVERIIVALSSEKRSLKQEDIDNIAMTFSQNEITNKQEILDAISDKKVKVEEEYQQLKNESDAAKQERDDVKNQHQSMIDSLQILMEKRFGINQPELLPQISEQEGTWRWLQNVLTVQYENYQQAFSNVKSLHNPECDQIIKLLKIESILTELNKFLTKNPLLEDERLMGLLKKIDSGMWLSNVFRADDLLKTYFSDKEDLKDLSTPLAITATLLQAALKELGVEIIKPDLFEIPPANLAQNERKKATNPLLKELLHEKVMTKLSDTVTQLVVDVERYGFVTAEGTTKTMKVLVADLGGWE